MRRFLIDHGEVGKASILLSAEESYHISRVLKLPPGSEIELFDGKGTLLTGVIEESGERVLTRILSSHQKAIDERNPLILYQADLKGKKMDFIIQKATELGVERVCPFISERSQGRLDGTRKRKKAERWQKLIVSACKQSKRLTLMECEQERSLPSLLQNTDDGDTSSLKLLFWEGEAQRTISDIVWPQTREPVFIMLGPEGGFSQQELSIIRESGWESVSLGSRILRAETATISAIAIVQHYLGSM